MKMIRLLSLASVFILLLCFSSWAQTGEGEKIGNYGMIDWVNQKIIAQGIGVPPEDIKFKSQAKAMSERAAVVVARRNLLEVVKGIHIDSTTRVKNLIYPKDAQAAKTQEDIIISKIEGELEFSTIDDVKFYDDGKTEVTVSVPLSGKLREILLELDAQAGQQPSSVRQPPNLERRVLQLENRVKQLEDQIAGLKKIAVQQEQLIVLFKNFTQIWMDWKSDYPVLSRIDYQSNQEVAALIERVRDQELRFSELSEKVNKLADRMTILEKNGTLETPGSPSSKSPYTGLVVDARNMEFKPCLKVRLFAGGELIYPGDYIDTNKSIKTGYVRYYRNMQSAQKCSIVGSMPLVIRAKGTYDGIRSLEIKAEDMATLKKIIGSPDNFMTNCKVVVVF